MSRWVRVQTSIFDHELFAAEPFSEREAWLWMITNAAWKDTIHRVGSEVVKVPAGSFFATIRDMQTRWRWKSTTRVTAFLKMLEAQGMIKHTAKTGKTHVSICNYDKYQNVEYTEKTLERQPEDSGKTQKTPVTPSSSLRSEQFEKETRERNEFSDWFCSWPSAASDDDDDAFKAWHELTEVERSEAKSRSSAYVEAAKGGGRTAICSAAKYLRKHMWKRLDNLKPPDKPPPKAAGLSHLQKPQTREEYLAQERARSERSFSR